MTIISPLTALADVPARVDRSTSAEQKAGRDVPVIARGEVVNVNYYADRNPSGTFNVRLLSGGVVSGGKLLTDVPMLQPGFGDPTSESPATGMVYLPEVGSRVLCLRDQTGWIIVGFLTGPVTTPDAQDRELLGQAYNPGIEQALSKSNKLVPAYPIPWIFGWEPGDALLGKGLMRVKVCGKGVVLGGPAALTVMKEDGEVLERRTTHEVRQVGYLHKHTYTGGLTQDEYVAAKKLPGAAGAVPPPPDAAVLTTTIYEANPYPEAFCPMLIEQRGHIPPALKGYARQVVEGEYLSADVITGIATGFAIQRDAVVQQVQKISQTQKAVGAEIDLGSHVEHFDRQVYSDGSWSLKAGNATHAPGAVKDIRVPQLDSELTYDAVTNTFTLRVGPSGAPLCLLQFDGTRKVATLVAPELDATIATKAVLRAATTSVEISTSEVELKSAAPVTVQAPQMTLKGNVKIEGSLEVTGEVQATPRRIRLGSHTHRYTDDGSPSVTAPPNP